MPARIHFASLAVGLLLGLVLLVSMAQNPVSTPLRVEYVPHPRDYMQIKEGTPYTVPAGKLFVLTGLGTRDGSPIALLKVDGLPELSTTPYTSQFGGPSIEPITPGFTVKAGSVIDLTTVASAGTLVARAWGYLANQ